MMAVGATVGFAKKLIMRHRHGNEIPLILQDPPEVRTLARFRLGDPASTRDLLTTLAGALAPDIDSWVVEGQVVHARRRGHAHDIEVLRLVDRGERFYTLELTRAWTGADLGEPARTLLIRLHDVLVADSSVTDLAWHWRQDRALAIAHPVPVAPALVPT
jgi:hypothetical protein